MWIQLGFTPYCPAFRRGQLKSIALALAEPGRNRNTARSTDRVAAGK
jgi:hypothetical protein